MDARDIVYTHVANEDVGPLKRGAQTKSMGRKPGVPDYLIFTPPPKYPHVRGVAIELKRREGGRTSAAQSSFLEKLNTAGWRAAVCPGAANAVDFLRRLGWE
jgi:hypothetical protein